MVLFWPIFPRPPPPPYGFLKLEVNGVIIRLKDEDVSRVSRSQARDFILIDSCNDLINKKDGNMNLGNLLPEFGLVDLPDTRWN